MKKEDAIKIIISHTGMSPIGSNSLLKTILLILGKELNNVSEKELRDELEKRF